MPSNLFLTDDGFVVKNDRLVGYFGDFRGDSVTLPNVARIITNQALAPFSLVKKVVIPEGVEEIGQSCFTHFCALSEIVLPTSLRKICDSAFYDCRNLKQLKLPDSVTEIGGAFICCTGIEIFEVPPNVERLTGFMFDKANQLKTVVLSEKQFEMIIDSYCSRKKSQGSDSTDGYCVFGNSGIRRLIVSGEELTAENIMRWLRKRGYKDPRIISTLFWKTPFEAALSSNKK